MVIIFACRFPRQYTGFEHTLCRLIRLSLQSTTIVRIVVLKTKMEMIIKNKGSAQRDPSLWGFLIRSSDNISTSEMKTQEEE